MPLQKQEVVCESSTCQYLERKCLAKKSSHLVNLAMLASPWRCPYIDPLKDVRYNSCKLRGGIEKGQVILRNVNQNSLLLSSACFQSPGDRKRFSEGSLILFGPSTRCSLINWTSRTARDMLINERCIKHSLSSYTAIIIHVCACASVTLSKFWSLISASWRCFRADWYRSSRRCAKLLDVDAESAHNAWRKKIGGWFSLPRWVAWR